jgi:hypothetical protein
MAIPAMRFFCFGAEAEVRKCRQDARDETVVDHS